MHGNVLLDTNTVIYALNSGLTLPPSNYYISIISEMELFSYSKLTELERGNIKDLLSHFKILNISQEIKELTIEIRKNHGIKLPDSIICATALVSGSILVSNDKQLSKVDKFNVWDLEKFMKS